MTGEAEVLHEVDLPGQLVDPASRIIGVMSFKNVDIENAMRRLADLRIEEAMREGKFDNLPGAGFGAAARIIRRRRRLKLSA